MNKFIRHIQDPEIPLRQRLFELLSAIALVEYFIVTIYQIVLGTDFLHIFTMVAGTAAFAVTVTLTFRTGNIRLGSVISGLLYFLIYPLTFFSSGGIHGGAPIVFGFALVYVFLVTEGPERVLSLAVCIAGTAACYIVSYLKPELLSRHTLSEEYVESFLAIMLVTLLVCSLFAFVTGVYKAENRIVQKQKKEIEELNGAQKRFFSSMSHEIRTPVNAIIGLNEMTLRGEISDEVRENSENIEAASRTLLHTVNEILDMSRLESGSMEIVEADYHTAAMLSEIVGMTWLQAHEKGLEFIVKADPGIPSVLKGDEPRIREILLNVIANAVKYTRRGSVTLSVSGHEEGEGSYTAVYDVSDTGIGIREESIPHLFTSFQRVDDQNTHAIEGTGLGLSIVKQLLDLMGGTVTVTSEYGKGSDFHIEIPQKISDGSPIGEIDFRKHISDVNTEDGKAGSIRSTDENSAESSGAEEGAEDAGSVLRSARILAVDDTPMNLLVVRKLLRDSVALVKTAESGAEALELTAKEEFDIILMDHQMPEMDGIECLRRIRSQEDGKCRNSKIVCMTAGAGSDMESIYKEEGFDGYLVKPVRGKILESELAGLMSPAD